MTGRYDSLYVSPHAGDVEASCGERLARETRRGLRALVVTLFGPAEAAASGGAWDTASLGLPDAPSRDPVYASVLAVLHGRQAGDDAMLAKSAAWLDEIAHRTKPRRLYLPLAVGGHVDHRLAHEAGVRVLRDVAPGRDVFFYEDRPYASAPGSVWLRLGQLGAWLPPAAVHAAQGAGLARTLLRTPSAPCTPARVEGMGEWARLRSNGVREWWHARGWRPLKALGLRLQPVLQEAGERYWLLLPPREDFIASHVAAIEEASAS